MIYIFIYNVVKIKANLLSIKDKSSNATFILLGSKYCIDSLSDVNKLIFDKIFNITRNFQSILYDEIEPIVLQYVKKYGADKIRLLSNEDSTQIVSAKLREKLRIPGENLEMVIPYTNKVYSKKKLDGTLHVPKFILFDKIIYNNLKDKYLICIADFLKFPMFAKPIDLVSSIETYFILDFERLKIVANKISSSQYEFEVDEFINKKLYHCDTIVINEKYKFLMSAKYANPLANFSKGLPMGSIPIKDTQLLLKFELACKKAIKKLGLFASAFHLEFFYDNKEDKITFLECAARTPGALVPEMYEAMYGFNIEELHYYTKLNMDDTINNIIKYNPSTYCAWLSYPKKSGIVSEIISPNLNVNINFISTVQKGELVNKSISLLDSWCHILITDTSYEKVNKAFDFLKKYEPIKVNMLY